MLLKVETMLEYEHVYEYAPLPARQINKDINPWPALLRSVSCHPLLF